LHSIFWEQIMKVLKQFNIPFVGMSKKIHQFEYSIDSTFFECFEDAPVNECAVNVKLEFDKRETFFQLKFFIDGTVNTPCDRCLEHYDQEIFGDFEMFVKFGSESPEETEDDILFISKNDDHVDISKTVYDYILLSIPIRCVHPEDENGNSGCNEEVIKKLNSKTEQSVDPRWAALENLKNKKD
jgi:uncharacterized protein